MSDIEIAKSYIRKIDNAAQRGIEFSLTFNQFKKLYNRKLCQITGVRMKRDNQNKGLSFTLDRLNSDLGYTKENTIACCAEANRIKGSYENPNTSKDLNLNQLIKLFTKMNQLGLIK